MKTIDDVLKKIKYELFVYDHHFRCEKNYLVSETEIDKIITQAIKQAFDENNNIIKKEILEELYMKDKEGNMILNRKERIDFKIILSKIFDYIEVAQDKFLKL